MPSAGDLVIYGIDAPGGHVSYIPETGAHAGPSPEELYTFIVCAAETALPSPITHPIQLYEHFLRYESSYVLAATLLLPGRPSSAVSRPGRPRRPDLRDIS